MNIKLFCEDRWSNLDNREEFIYVEKQRQSIDAESTLEFAKNQKSLKLLSKRTLYDWIVYSNLAKRKLKEF